MPTDTVLARDRVILCHFDSYSTALVFARWPTRTLLWPGALPEGAAPLAAPADAGPEHDGAAVRERTVEALKLNPDEVVLMPEFNEWIATPDGPARIHLLRFTTFEAPHKWLEPYDAVFKPLSELRGSSPVELGLLREVFNLIIGGGAGRR